VERGLVSDWPGDGDGHQAVALPGGRCSSANIRSYIAATGAATTTPGAALQPADRLRRLLVAGIVC